MNRFLDEAAVRLLAAMILFAPWAFGSTPTWAVWTMNAMGWTLGAVVLARKWVAWREGGPADAPAESRVRVWLTRILAALTVLFLLYVLVSALNYRADYLEFESRFAYRENYISWLPHSYDVTQTWRAFGSYAALAAVFWGVRDYLRPRHGHGSHHREGPRGEESHGPHLSRRLVFLLSLLCLNVGAVALEGIIQRWSGTNKLLWILEPRINNTPEAQFGPYAYRANAAQLFNLVWPVCLGLCWAMAETGMARTRRVLWGFLLGAALVTAAAPLMTTSRAGAAIAVVCLGLLGAVALVTQRGSTRVYWVLGFALLAVGGGVLFGAKSLRARIWSPVYTYPTEMGVLSEGFAVRCRVAMPTNSPNKFMGLVGLSGNELQLDQSPGALAVFVQKDGALEAMSFGTEGRVVRHERAEGFYERFAGREIEVSVQCNANLSFAVNGSPLPSKSVIALPPGQAQVIQSGQLWVGRIYRNSGVFEGRIDSVGLLTGLAGSELNPLLAVQVQNVSWSDRLRRHFGSRSEILRNARQMAEDYPWLGSGAGTFVSLYQLYRASTSQTRHAYLHNDWLEYRITLGRVGFGLLLALLLFAVALVGFRGGSAVPALLVAAQVVALGGALLHARVDFPFQVYSVAFTFLVLGAILSSLEYNGRQTVL